MFYKYSRKNNLLGQAAHSYISNERVSRLEGSDLPTQEPEVVAQGDNLGVTMI